ncbi:MAG: twitching motility protein PilT [Candidatus Brocadia sp. WS118]|nr:MAG: twitching motility protein PilT [Candidatus Brocadia sp. WS118]
MNAVLLDTNIISFIFKKDSRAKSYEPHLKGKILTTSFMTVAELFQWAMVRNWGEKRKQRMENELKKYIVFPFDINTCRLWGEIRAKCIKVGQPISAQDAWIAATARQHSLPLVTHNPDHFKAVDDLEIITVANP